MEAGSHYRRGARPEGARELSPVEARACQVFFFLSFISFIFRIVVLLIVNLLFLFLSRWGSLQENNEGLIFTPFERNLEVWRQLWRVIERSEIVVQIVDARNPTLFRCTDLEKYVKEISKKKKNLLLINKADLLTPVQRCVGSLDFTSRDLE